MVRRSSSSSSRSPSIFSVQDSDDSEYVSDSPPRKRTSTSVKRKRIIAVASTSKTKVINQAPNGKAKAEVDSGGGVEDIEDVGVSVNRAHGEGYHSVEHVGRVQQALLDWFEQVREKRGMPWRKPYDPRLTMEEQGQRAYEIWVSEVMLQQTQVATVIAYWQRWMVTWPTIADLAKADTEEVNAAWRGLGYYRRARSLLAGAKTVMGNAKYEGRLPNDPAVLEKEIDGVGRYTAGAICSMAYGVRTPIVDGNIHRLFTRLLAVHAPQTGPATIKFLWSAAEQLVERLPIGDGIAGNWNQALMELGSQVCKPVSPECNVCPMQSGCKAFSELSASPPAPTKSECSLCAPIPTSTPSDRIPTVMVFPMKKEKKASRVEQETVSVVEWHGAEGQRRWLFAKRPEKGLLAGLFEPPTSPVSVEASALQRLESAISTSSKYVTFSTNDVDALRSTGRSIGSIPHIFSHINMTYHIYHFIITSPSDSPPPIKNKAPSQTLWLDEPRVESANIGTGVKKVWTEIYGAWGKFDSTIKSISMPKSKKFKKDNNKGKVSKDGLVQKTLGDLIGDKLVKKIVMPAMPVRKDIKMTKSTTTVTISDENVEM